ncbi:MAG: TIGR03790 family protein [Limisphaerales bacterium]
MKRFVVGLVTAILAWGGVAPALAGNPGDEVVVIYNKRVPESKPLALYYAQRRQVPAEQVIPVDLPATEELSRAQYRDGLEMPLARFLEGRKLWRMGQVEAPATAGRPAKVQRLVVSSRIRYAVLCYGVPLRIAEDPNLMEAGMDKATPEGRRNGGAVDSELALLPLVQEKYPLSGWLRNPVYGTTNAAAVDPTNGVLIVARLDGPSPAIARGLVDKAIEAETHGLWGRAYFDLRNTTEPGLKMGDEWIRSASELCRHLGLETVVDENAATFPAGFPMSHIALYLGWYDENVSGPFAQPAVEFMPGAFAYHLHSFSACSLRVTNLYWVGPLLAKGATITMGCVAEPYLVGTPDLATFVGRLVYSGFSFGEAAYASQRLLSWQITVVGDPLYRPFGRNLDQLFMELETHESPWREWAYLRLLDLNLANGKPLSAGVTYLEQLDLTQHSAILTEKLADLYSALGRPLSAVHEYQHALTLGPSPQQRLRLRLVLGEKLAAMNREELATADQDAYEDYQKLLQEAPDYPDKQAIYRRLLPLAQKLNKTAEAEQYEAALRPATGNNGNGSGGR